MPASLDDLIAIDGVDIAFEFAPSGRLTDFRAAPGISEVMAETVAQFAATMTMNFNTLAGAFTQLSGRAWIPQTGWMYSGGEWTVMIGEGGYRGVLIPTARTDFNRLFEALGGTLPIGVGADLNLVP